MVKIGIEIERCDRQPVATHVDRRVGRDGGVGFGVQNQAAKRRQIAVVVLSLLGHARCDVVFVYADGGTAVPPSAYHAHQWDGRRGIACGATDYTHRWCDGLSDGR